jgi:hypothetical protein
MRSHLKNSALAFLLACATLTGVAFGQTQAINGSIRGHVEDAMGGSVAAAKVSVLGDSTGFGREAETNADGYFVFPNLPLGAYTLTIKKEGFNTDKHTGIVLDAGVEATIDAQLKVGSVETSVEVTGGAPIVDPARVSTGRTITFEETNNLPLTSRNPYNFILFQPGVSGHPNPELGIPRLLNTNGLVDHVNYQLDGTVDTETDRTGLRLFAIANSYVSEVQVVSNSFAPEFGRTAGNIYNVITGSGSNQFHGEALYIGRPLDLVARPILATPTTLLPVANNFAANASGAIIKNKLFYFGSYEHVKRSVPNPITITAANAAALNLSAGILTNPPAIEHAGWVDARVDWVITQKHQFFVRYNYFRNQYPFNTNIGGLNTLSVAADFQDRAHVLGAQLLSAFSPTVLNELRFGWPYRNEQHIADPLTGKGPEILITGVANFGGSNAVGDRFQEKVPNLNDNFTVIRGAHTIKAGFGYQQNLDVQAGQIYTSYTFPSIAAYQAAAAGTNLYGYTTFGASVGTPGAWYHSLFWDGFIQDSWQVTPKLLVVGGLRYDKFNGPGGDPTAAFSYSQKFHSPNKDFAPRLGIAYSPDSKTVVRVNSGIFFEAPPTNLWYNALYQDGGTSSYTASIAGSAPGAPAFSTTNVIVNGTLPRSSSNIYTISPTFRNGYAINSSVQITRQLTQNDALTVGYASTMGRELEFLRNINLINPTGSLADGRPIYSSTVSAATRLDPRFNNIALQDSGANSSYNALITNYQHRAAYGLTVNASYTWSHSISDAPEGNAYDQGSSFISNPVNRNFDHGNTSINRPNAFSLSTVWTPVAKLNSKALNYLANNNQLTILGVASSGDEQNITSNVLLNGDSLAGTSVTRPLYVARNSVRTPAVYQVDMRYNRTFFKIKERIAPSFFIEANNILNHPNITSINTVATVSAATGLITANPSFLPTSTLLEGRIVQLGVRAIW